MSVLIVGSVALDSVKTPFGDKKDILGGSATHAAISASFFTSVAICGVIGSDFPQQHIDFLKSKNIDTSGLHIHKGETFRWSGFYEYDMNQAHTLETKLNVYGEHSPQIPDNLKQTDYLFLANYDPEIQLKVLKQIKRPKLVVADTMNFWIQSKREALYQVVREVDFIFMNDAEVRQFMETPNIPLAAHRLLELGAKGVIIKKGEHGALLFTKNTHFSAPSYPQEMLRDPTGAGDSFAGGFMGYLSKTNDLSETNIRKAILFGSVMASFNVEDFSMDRLKRLNYHEVTDRFQEFKRFMEV